jgi:O-antigen/teichoic acid export membrane protein
MGARFAGQLMAWAITIVVIRILTPEDYGLMSMSVVVISLLILANTFGLDAILVQRKDLDEASRRQIFGFVILLNLCLFALLFVTAPWIAGFYGEPRVMLIMRVLALQFIVLIFETMPLSQLGREINFRGLSIVEFATLFAGSLVGLGFALGGAGIWALVVSNLATTTTRIIGLNIIQPVRCRPRFTLRGARSLFTFGGTVTMDRTLHFAFAESDKFIGGKLLGKELLGYYAVASHIASLPIHKLMGLINAVAFPAFARTQDDRAKVAEYMLKAARIMSMLAFPVFWGISSVAAELTALLLGEKWLAAALPLQILSLVMPLRMLMNVFPPLLWGIGRPDVSATNFLIAALVMPAAFVVGAQGGAVGLAVAWLIAFPVVVAIAVSRGCRLVDVPFTAFLREMLRPVVAAGGMYLAVLAAKPFVYGGPGEIVNLLQLVMLGVFVYGGMVIAIHRSAVRELVVLIRS